MLNVANTVKNYIRYGEVVQFPIPYTLSDKDEVVGNHLYFSKHPKRVYAENCFVKWLFDSNRLQIKGKLEATYQSMIALDNSLESRNIALSKIEKVVNNVRYDTGSFDREFFDAFLKVNVTTYIVNKTILKKDIERKNAVYEIIADWFTDKYNQLEAEYIGQEQIQADDNNVRMSSDPDLKPVCIESSGVLFEKIKSPFTRKGLLHRFKTTANKHIGIDNDELEEFIDYCFYFKSGDDKKQLRSREFKIPTNCSAIFMFEFMYTLSGKRNKRNISKLLSICFSWKKWEGYSLGNLEKNIGKGKKFGNKEVSSIIDKFNIST